MTYSGGMRRRLDLAMTLVGDPRIIFLDEPTTGLDPRSRRVMWDIVRELVADGVTILLTTQYLEEADRLAEPDRAARRRPDRRPGHAGRAQAARPRRQRPARVRRRGASSIGPPRALGDGVARRRRGSRSRCPSDGGVRSLRALLDRLDAEAIEVDGLSVRSADLDDVFLSLTGRRDGHPTTRRSPTP